MVTAQEVVEAIKIELSGATFDVSGDTAIMRGVICAQTPSRVLELSFKNPSVRTLVLQDVPGSIDDVANLRAGRYIRQLGLGTHVPADGMVASGGTDLFLAGAHRSAEPGALFGIHSWAGGPVEATDLPRDHEDHRLYLDYYAEMDIPTDFYWRTLAAAPPEDIHWMTEEELKRFGFFLGAGALQE
ncbi:MAG: alpha/beta hydrolase [Deltaproteobacteria bacterium]|nr:alpha/beta hydrolase [Deltaproteobacteria bacterium]